MRTPRRCDVSTPLEYSPYVPPSELVHPMAVAYPFETLPPQTSSAEGPAAASQAGPHRGLAGRPYRVSRAS